LWHGQTKLLFSSCQAIEHPRCGQTEENAQSRPVASLHTYKAFSETILRQPSRCSIFTSFLTGEVTEARSSTLPTSFHDDELVAVSRGCSRKRKSGTERSAPTPAAPAPSKSPRKDRRLEEVIRPPSQTS